MYSDEHNWNSYSIIADLIYKKKQMPTIYDGNNLQKIVDQSLEPFDKGTTTSKNCSLQVLNNLILKKTEAQNSEIKEVNSGSDEESEEEENAAARYKKRILQKFRDKNNKCN